MTFDIALTGINAASAELNTISHNIANNATTGFKRSEARFSDVYAVSTGAAAGNAGGQGVSVAQIRQDFKQGDLKFTENNLDLAVEGGGMFQVNDRGSIGYTRDGSFGLDREGFIVTASGSRLTGYTVDDDEHIRPIQGDLKIDFADLQPKPSSEVDITMNLDADTVIKPPFDINDPETYNFSTSTTVYDSLGGDHVATMYLHKDAPNAWSSYVFVDDVEVSQAGGDELLFDAGGELEMINGAPATAFSTGSFSPAPDAAAMTLQFDVAGATQFDGPFGTNSLSQDGHSAGRLDNFDIDPSGVISGRFSNGQSRIMGQVTLANFSNVQGLAPSGDNTWTDTFASGEPVAGVPGSASLGLIQAGVLEGSNVDVTQELVAMIGAQRSFQANAQVISTGDQLTQTVINIRR